MDPSVSPNDKIWFLSVCHHISTGLCSVRSELQQNSIKFLYAKRLSAPVNPAVASPAPTPPTRQQTTVQQQFLLKNQMPGTKRLQPARTALNKTHIRVFSKDGQTNNSSTHNILLQKYHFLTPGMCSERRGGQT